MYGLSLTHWDIRGFLNCILENQGKFSALTIEMLESRRNNKQIRKVNNKFDQGKHLPEKQTRDMWDRCWSS